MSLTPSLSFKFFGWPVLCPFFSVFTNSSPHFRLTNMYLTTASALATLSLSIAVEAHSVVTEVKGANGVNGVGMGVTDVSGKKLRLFNQVHPLLSTVPILDFDLITTGFPISQ